MSRKPYPSDVSDEEWNFVAPYLALIDEQAPQRRHSLREVFNALRWLARAGAAWRMLPNDLPPWPVVYQQFRRWEEAGCFEALVSDMRSIIRTAEGRCGQPSAVILDGRTLQSSCQKRPACRVRRLQTAQRQQSAHGCGYAGPSPDADGHACR